MRGMMGMGGRGEVGWRGERFVLGGRDGAEDVGRLMMEFPFCSEVSRR